MKIDNADNILLSKEMLQGMFELGERFRFRPFPGNVDIEIFKEKGHPLAENADWTNRYTRPISKTALNRFFKTTIPSENDIKLDIALHHATCLKDKNQAKAIVNRFLSKEIDYDQTMYILAYCTVLRVKLEKSTFAELILDNEAFRESGTYASSAYSYIEWDPDIVDNSELFKFVQLQTDLSSLRDHPEILIRLIRSGQEVFPIIEKIISDCIIGTVFIRSLATAILKDKNRDIFKKLLEIDDDKMRIEFLLQCIRLSNHVFALDILEEALEKYSDSRLVRYLIPVLASVKPGNGDWLKKYLENSNDWNSRFGATYALAWYPELHGYLSRLSKDDDDDDVVLAAESVRLSLTLKKNQEYNIAWNIWCSYILKESFSDLFVAFCKARNLPDNDFLINEEFMKSSSADFNELKEFYQDRRHLLINWIDKNNIDAIDLENITDNDEPDIIGRAALLMASYNDKKSQIFFDQYLSDTDSENSASWAVFLLGACGGPLSALASLKYRMIRCRENPKSFRTMQRDVGVLSALGSVDGFFYDSMVLHFGTTLVKEYPDLLGYWIRQRNTTKSDDILLTKLSEPTKDPFISDLRKIGRYGEKYEQLLFPERQIYNNIGHDLSVRAEMAGMITVSRMPKERKLSLLSNIVTKSDISQIKDVVLVGLPIIEKNKEILLDAFRTILYTTKTSDNSNIIVSIADLKIKESYELIIDLWTDASDEVTLEIIRTSIKKSEIASFSNLVLYSLNDRAQFLSDISFDYSDYLSDPLKYLEKYLEKLIESKIDKHIGKRLIIHPYNKEPPVRGKILINQEIFNSLILLLRIEFRDDESGSILCEVTGERSGELLKLMFEKKKGVAFWAYWV